MEPKTFLNILSREWQLMVEIFERCKQEPLDSETLQRTIESHKQANSDTDLLFERLLNHGILEQPLQSETLYQLGNLAETIISQLLQEHRLGLSESIQAHIKHLDGLSKNLLQSTIEHDAHGIASGVKKLRQHTQDIKHQVKNNLQAIRHIVAEAKKQETSKPLHQRYADIIEAWEQYISPMGDMIEPNAAFDSITDSALKRINQAINNLDSAGMLISEETNMRYAAQMLTEMRHLILYNFQLGRDILRPLYEVARLNSKLTRGVSILLDDLYKGRIRHVGEYSTLNLHHHRKRSLISANNALLKYHCRVKEVQEQKPPKITTPNPKNRKNTLPPLNFKSVIKQFKKDLPIPDALQWAIQYAPTYPTDKILTIVTLIFSQPDLSITKGLRKKYQTRTHQIEGPSITVENHNG